jgi:hypothetical protein
VHSERIKKSCLIRIRIRYSEAHVKKVVSGAGYDL